VTKHPFHLVSPSPWPFLAAVLAFFTVVTLILSWHCFSPCWLLPPALGFGYTCLEWSRSINIESTYLGCHTSLVRKLHLIGFALFIVSEIFFFVSWFWSFFHFSLRPAIEVGSVWPPAGILVSSPFTVPLLNTTVLLTSGATLTWSHCCLTSCLYFSADRGLILTILLGLFFICLQTAEYYFSSFTLADSCFGSSFYILTGFHGLHVQVGTCLLLGTLYRLRQGSLTNTRHTLFTVSAWYWHFVDVVWLLLFFIVYIWGS